MKRQLIVVPDDHYHRKTNFTFLVYDFESGTLLHTSPNNIDLCCDEVAGQGRPTFRPFGVASDDDYIYIASHKKLGKYNKAFEYCGLVDIPMYVNTHQILKSDKDFYVTHTSVNAIGIHGKTDTFFNVSSLQCVEQPLHPIHADTHDTNHVNSVFEYNGKIYFCLHNRGKTSSQFGYFDKITYESSIIATAGHCCHDIQILNDKLYSLSSGTGDIIEIDLSNGHSNSYQIVNPRKTFLRGMTVLDNKIIFSGSNQYSNDTIYMNNCFVSSFDPLTKNVRQRFNITHADIIVSIKLV